MEKSALNRISKIAIAIGFGVMICGTSMRPAFADDHGGDRHHEARHGEHHDEGHNHRNVYTAPAPDYYYAPPPYYYYAPEPEYYYPPQPDYAPPSEGINLFFGLR